MDMEEEDAMMEAIQGLHWHLMVKLGILKLFSNLQEERNYKLGKNQVPVFKQIANYEENVELATID